MIRIIRGRDYQAHGPALASMFEDRKKLFVDLLGWDVPVVEGRYEVDAYDGANATYIVALDAHGMHQGSMRLLPATRPHLLDTLFAELCADAVPRGPDVFEITRLCLPTRHTAAARLEIRNALITAMVDHALANGIGTLTGVVEDRFRKEVLAMGWLAEPLGPAIHRDGKLLGAFAIHLAADTPARLRWTGIYPGMANEGDPIPAASAGAVA